MNKKINSLRKLQVIGEAQIGQRIDNYLFNQLKGLPKSRVYKAIRKGEVRVNKKRIKPEYKLQLDDEVRIPPLRIASTEQIIALPSRLVDKLEQNIIVEDSNFIILNKPAGIAVHGGSGISFGVIEALRRQRPQAKFLELVHRIDRETSGCLLLTKKSSLLKEVHSLLVAKEVKKTYWLLVAGHCQFVERQIDLPLQKNILKSGERIVVTDDQGKLATTIFRRLKYVNNMTLLEALPITGRTHQIRVHAAAMGHPIIGDEKYGQENTNKLAKNMGINQLCLHASSLSFYLPSKQQVIGVCAVLKEPWQKIIKF